jgi:hypothetical protein
LFIVLSCEWLCLLPIVCFVLLSFATWSPKDFSTSDGIPTRDDLPDLTPRIAPPEPVPEALTQPVPEALTQLVPEPVPEALTQPVPECVPRALTPTLVLEPEVRGKTNGGGANLHSLKWLKLEARTVGLCQPLSPLALSPFGFPRRLHCPGCPCCLCSPLQRQRHQAILSSCPCCRCSPLQRQRHQGLLSSCPCCLRSPRQRQRHQGFPVLLSSCPCCLRSPRQRQRQRSQHGSSRLAENCRQAWNRRLSWKSPSAS